MPRRTTLVLVLVAAAASGGCGTLDNIQRPCVAPPEKPDGKVCRLYGGVRGDWAIVSEYPLSRAPSPVDYVAIPVLAAGDLFFDVVADTLTLPYTAYEEARRAFFPPTATSQFASIVVSEDVSVPATPQAATAAPQPALGTNVGR